MERPWPRRSGARQMDAPLSCITVVRRRSWQEIPPPWHPETTSPANLNSMAANAASQGVEGGRRSGRSAGRVGGVTTKPRAERRPKDRGKRLGLCAVPSAFLVAAPPARNRPAPGAPEKNLHPFAFHTDKAPLHMPIRAYLWFPFNPFRHLNLRIVAVVIRRPPLLPVPSVPSAAPTAGPGACATCGGRRSGPASPRLRLENRRRKGVRRGGPVAGKTRQKVIRVAGIPDDDPRE